MFSELLVGWLVRQRMEDVHREIERRRLVRAAEGSRPKTQLGWTRIARSLTERAEPGEGGRISPDGARTGEVSGL